MNKYLMEDIAVFSLMQNYLWMVRNLISFSSVTANIR